MKQVICRSMFFLSAVFLFSFHVPVFAAPQLTKVFDKERSAKEDAVFFRNNDVLRGEVLNKDFSITTPYGILKVPLDKCAGISFEGSRSNTEALVTVNFNRYTGIINDRIISFKIGSSGTEISIRKEKIRFILLKTKPNETDTFKSESKTDLFIMANGDLVTGNPVRDSFTIATDYAKIPVSFAETKEIEMQGGDNVTAVIKKKNGDMMRGTLVTEEFSLRLDIGFQCASHHIPIFLLYDGRDIVTPLKNRNNYHPQFHGLSYCHDFSTNGVLKVYILDYDGVEGLMGSKKSGDNVIGNPYLISEDHPLGASMISADGWEMEIQMEGLK